MSESSERENKVKAALISVGIHTALAFVLFFVVAWRAPGPPADEIGVVLNYGVDDQGSGDVQPTEPVGTEDAKDEKVEETKPEPVAQQVIPKETDANEAEEIVGQTESPVTVKKDDKKEEKKEEVKKVEKPIEKPVEVKPKEEIKKPDPNGAYNPDATKAGDSKEKGGKEGKPGGEGDDKDKAGDKGDPRGTYEKGAYSGDPGGGNGGPSLTLDGWDWDFLPDPKIPQNETSGRVVYVIEVDENGELRNYQRETSSVSAATERACVAALTKLTFSKKPGAKVPPITKGRITFIIRAQ